MAPTLGWLIPALHTLCLAAGLAAGTEGLVPRLSFKYDSPRRTVRWFEADGVSHYTTLLLSQDGQTLYVGAREAIFALNSTDFQPGLHQQTVLWSATAEKKKQCSFKGKDLQRDCQNYVKVLVQLNSTHLYTCGTYAFSPSCSYVRIEDFALEKDASGEPILEDGKPCCPYDPEYKATAILVDGELYAGTVSNFKANEPIIHKSQESRTVMKTDHSFHWLEDPAFVGSAYIRESLPKGNAEGDDDKIYFFFSETGKEFDFFENTIVSRIARVCKGDLGGERVLQKRWTTFLKAQLLCSRPDDGFPFNVLQDMFVLTPGEEDWKNTIFYGVFTSQWNKGSASSSAVCAFTINEVQKAFNGAYKEVNWETEQWYTYTEHVPEPRPGACINNQARRMGIHSSLQMPDRVLNLVKDHFLMDSIIRSQPLLMQARVQYQQISVQRVKGLRKTYDVLFLGTDDGRLHKAVAINKTVHIIEEMVLFKNRNPVQELLLDASKGMLYASSYSAVVQIPLSNCSTYSSCGECVLSRDPYCAWHSKACVIVPRFTTEMDTQNWVQDIEEADTRLHCPKGNSPGPVGRALQPAEEIECQKIVLPANTMNSLTCTPLSNFASKSWFHNGEKINSSYTVRSNGDLLLVRSPQSFGSYECWSTEEGFRKLMANYCVEPEGAPKATTVQVDTSKPLPAPKPNDELFLNLSKSSSTSQSHSSRITSKTYWNEFMIMSILFGVAVVILGLFLLYKHRKGMKTFLKPGDVSDMQHKKPQKSGKPAESLPLHGSTAPNAVLDHKGYQTLNDNYLITTPYHDPLTTNKNFSESEKRPLNIKDTLVEVSPQCQRPRVRLGSVIRDSVV
ncbi:semaphorin-4B [Ambystoma mexicanum]|uniref:semaphorin-4B n=1 Tax=Ambystoma mexicanum TaxID=8296 RepID=UPI0037E8FC03